MMILAVVLDLVRKYGVARVAIVVLLLIVFIQLIVVIKVLFAKLAIEVARTVDPMRLQAIPGGIIATAADVALVMPA